MAIKREEVMVARCIRFPADVSRMLEMARRNRPEMTLTAIVVEAVREKYMASEAVLKEV